jgi:hypothetical protein
MNVAGSSRNIVPASAGLISGVIPGDTKANAVLLFGEPVGVTTQS